MFPVDTFYDVTELYVYISTAFLLAYHNIIH